ncbi:hypothetical protein [Pseudonocardia parietis]|uniref:DUF1440 domain-containing protein n=1 Tax=Pseudonocardia parietis TaxID=570936 RepID=A0ABS4W782_9PSEU|nr:hypothetical protein [Pseudonocardia parietis]MBP2372060.1 hypothetical protein [Pseudonocardia parietis]
MTTTMLDRAIAGAAAGAAGTTALNATTYLDMAALARPASTTPEQTVGRIEDVVPSALSQDGPNSPTADNRRAGLGALLGIAAGMGTGMAYGLIAPRLTRLPLWARGVVAGLAANVASTAPMAALGVTDPRRWPGSSWVRDLVPHVTYGVATAAVYRRLTGC